MSEQPQVSAAHEAQTVDAGARQASSAPSPRNSYLKVFGPDTGVFEITLNEDCLTIGRSDSADITLPHHTVSRIHATIALRDGQYVLEDADSNYGITVNDKRVERAVLQHGDSIQISLYVLQFRTHPMLAGAAAAAQRAKTLLRNDFCLLPSTMKLQIRTLQVDPREIFRSGDTLRVGQGGLLIPVDQPPDDSVCLELDLMWPNQKSRRYLGEILGVITDDVTNWMCVKLHTVPRQIHDVVVEAASPGAWEEIAPT